ncbi:MAG: cytochrome c peroxidase, partial [Pseudomonadota bacterium]
MASSALAGPLGPDDFRPVDPAAAEVGRLLFYDKILSGNQNISCGTCHHHELGTTDRLSLGIGEGGEGIGRERIAGDIERRVPRNAPALWNLGAEEIRVLFHDGRLSLDPMSPTGFDSPVEEALPDGIETIVAAQALLPLLAETEMAGDAAENPVARAARRRPQEAWAILARRVRSIPAYREMLVAAFDLEAPEEIEIVHVANALGAFVSAEWQSHDSRYDRHLAGEAALTEEEAAGRDLFFVEVGCAGCHAGPLFSDHGFHALGLPSFGPGRTRAFDPVVRDRGRLNETDRLEDAYRFRTPMLRNVALTAPYGHNGAYPTLEGMIRHHMDPAAARRAWKPAMAELPEVEHLASVDFVVFEDAREMARLASAIDVDLP